MYLASGGNRSYILGQILTWFWRFFTKYRFFTRKFIFSLTYILTDFHLWPILQALIDYKSFWSFPIWFLYSFLYLQNQGANDGNQKNLCSRITIVGLVFFICYFFASENAQRKKSGLKTPYMTCSYIIFTLKVESASIHFLTYLK